jgi:peptidyl-prolyl cis-trans isomerase B (cyclophilin B)
MTNTPANATMSNAPLNTMALVGFILSLCGLISGITAIPGIVLSHIGLSQIKRTGESGRGFAVAGLIVGYCLVGLSVLAVFFIVLFAFLIPLMVAGSLASTNLS